MARKKYDDLSSFTQENLVRVTYDAVRQAMNGEAFDMRLSPEDSAPFVAVVNMGIDSRLQACFVPDRGDKASIPTGRIAILDGREVHGIPTAAAKIYLNVEISPESMPVLLRRLYNELTDGGVDGLSDTGMRLASCIMQTLGFNDAGKYVGRDD